MLRKWLIMIRRMHLAEAAGRVAEAAEAETQKSASILARSTPTMESTISTAKSMSMLI
jgi:hypothetical protein